MNTYQYNAAGSPARHEKEPNLSNRNSEGLRPAGYSPKSERKVGAELRLSAALVFRTLFGLFFYRALQNPVYRPGNQKSE